MTNIILSVQPKWAAMILDGKKTVEIRKSAPKPPFTVWMYCTKKEKTVGVVRIGEINYGIPNDKPIFIKTPEAYWRIPLGGHGKVIAKFVVEKVDEIAFDEDGYADKGTLNCACITQDEFDAYAGERRPLYAWHITALEIIEPMELKEFKFDGKVYNYAFHAFEEVPVTLHRPPQSWQYVAPPHQITIKHPTFTMKGFADK